MVAGEDKSTPSRILQGYEAMYEKTGGQRVVEVCGRVGSLVLH